MDAQKMRQAVYWGGHVMRNKPVLFIQGLHCGVADRLFAPDPDIKICIGTHHKALTVLFARTFQSFSALTGRRYTSGHGKELDYSANVLLDYHSQFDWPKLAGRKYGFHVTRDPRDILVSSAHYHTHSSEPWLHTPFADFGGQTYQEKINSLSSLEERLLFEIDHSGGSTIRQMLDWTPQPGITEVTYDQMVGPNALAAFCEAVQDWPLKPRSKALVCSLFDYFSLGGPGARGNRHIRNASSGQWKEHFTQDVSKRFDEAFPDADLRFKQASSNAPKIAP